MKHSKALAPSLTRVSVAALTYTQRGSEEPGKGGDLGSLGWVTPVKVEQAEAAEYGFVKSRPCYLSEGVRGGRGRAGGGAETKGELPLVNKKST